MPGTTISEIVVAWPCVVARGKLSWELQWRMRACGASNDDELSGFCRLSDDLSNGWGGCSIGCLEARVLRLTVLGGAWKLWNSPRSYQKLREMRFPQTAPIVGGQNSSSHLFLGSEPPVRALAWLGTKWENDTRFTVVRPMGPTST
jgi:hypothetical protein